MTDPKQYNRPDRPTLTEDDIPGLGLALLTLTQEVWILRDRMARMEKVLSSSGKDVAGLIDDYQPDEDMKAELAGDSKQLLDRILAAIAGEYPAPD